MDVGWFLTSTKEVTDEGVIVKFKPGILPVFKFGVHSALILGNNFLDNFWSKKSKTRISKEKLSNVKKKLTNLYNLAVRVEFDPRASSHCELPVFLFN